jgi:hypothetical protein
MKKALLSIAAAALTLAPAAGLARPQWVPISADGKCHANYNAIRKNGPIFVVPFSCDTEDAGKVAGESHLVCAAWSYFLVVEGRPAKAPGPIEKDSVAESAAYLVCK